MKPLHKLADERKRPVKTRPFDERRVTKKVQTLEHEGHLIEVMQVVETSSYLIVYPKGYKKPEPKDFL